jgi:uncharacterized protein
MYTDNLQQELAKNGVVHFYVRIIPNAPITAITESLPDGSLKIKVQALPEHGKANVKLLQLLAHEFNVRVHQVQIKSGAMHRHKLIAITL